MPTFLTHLHLNRNFQSIAFKCVCVPMSALCVCISIHERSRVYVIFYVIFVPRYQFGEQGSTWWPVINVYSSAACAVALTTGNYVAGRPCHHKGSHTFDWYESLPIYYSSQTQGHRRLSRFKVALSFKRNHLAVLN